MSPDDENVIMCQPSNDPFDLPDEWIARAEEELGEYPDIARNNVKELRCMVEADKNLITRIDDTFLTAFLRARKHNVEKAFQMLKQYYEIRKKYPSYFKTILPSEMQFVYDAKTHAVLHQRDSQGRAILLVKTANFDTKVLNAEKIISVANTSLQLLVEDAKVQIAGIVMVLDLANFTIYQQMRLVNPKSVWIMINFLQDSFPMRLREIHIINTPFFFDALFACFAPFFKEKFRQRIKVHGKSMASLYSCLEPMHLPKDWGGVGPVYNNNAMFSCVQRYEDKIREWRGYGITT